MRYLLSSVPLLCAILTSTYFLLAISIFHLLNKGIPPLLEQILCLLAAPALFLLSLWTPILKHLGLTTGDFWWFPYPQVPLLIGIARANRLRGTVSQSLLGLHFSHSSSSIPCWLLLSL